MVVSRKLLALYTYIFLEMQLLCICHGKANCLEADWIPVVVIQMTEYLRFESSSVWICDPTRPATQRHVLSTTAVGNSRVATL